MIGSVITDGQRFGNDLSFAESEMISGFPIPKGAIVKDKYGENETFRHGVTYVYENIGGEQGLRPEEKYLMYLIIFDEVF